MDIFTQDVIGRKKIKDDELLEQNIVNIDGIDVDISNTDRAVFFVKVQFLYEVILRQALAKFPSSQTIMFLKAYITFHLLKNKHLTLTSITHIQASQKKKGYLKQVESLISQNYFLNL